jgi:hypothetical protein
MRPVSDLKKEKMSSNIQELKAVTTVQFADGYFSSYPGKPCEPSDLNFET